jgi:BMFP domain-containing protein YqiC
MYDDTTRQGRVLDHMIADIADAFREYMLSGDDPLSEKRWRVTGYRFAKALAQLAPGRTRGLGLTKQLADGMRMYCDENASLPAPVLYDTAKADALEEKAEKLLAVAAHPNTADAERRAFEHQFVRLYTALDLAIVSLERFNALRQIVTRTEEAITFLKREHPHLFLWRTDAPKSYDDVG